MMDPFASLPDLAPGSVWLVGAGPGDPGLLPLLALHALRQAEVVVSDALVDARILALAAPGAVIESLGKRGGRPSPKQAEISARLVDLARQNRRVVRLKGGDPFLFGRGAEEAAALAEAGIPFRVVPGITAGIGGLAYAGIPATAREAGSAVLFLTGHDPAGGLPDLDWPAVARAAPVLVVYMAMRTLEALTARLIESGRPTDEPAAVVSRAATPAQRVVEAPLAGIAAAARAAGLEAPALLVTGEAVRLRAVLRWWD